MADRKMQHINFGAPMVPLIPVGDFTKLDRKLIEDAWQIVGPSVGRNLGNFRPAPLWMTFAACYLEGFDHGVGTLQEMQKPPQLYDFLGEET